MLRVLAKPGVAVRDGDGLMTVAASGLKGVR
jgi:hypothetical protein